MLLATSVGEVACPCASVCAVALVWPPANVADGPLAGAVKVTVNPAPTGLPLWSSTVTTSGLANAAPTVVVWPEPDAATMLAG